MEGCCPGPQISLLHIVPAPQVTVFITKSTKFNNWEKAYITITDIYRVSPSPKKEDIYGMMQLRIVMPILLKVQIRVYNGSPVFCHTRLELIF